MRIAFVDLVFSWPPVGGAPLDLYKVITGLERLGHDVHLFFGADPDRWDRGALHPDELPFPATRLDFPQSKFTPEFVPAAFRTAIDAWKPEAVFVGFGFFLKPYVVLALRHYPVIWRCYTYEPACPRDTFIFKNDDVCPNNFLCTPNVCRRCTLHSLASEIASPHPQAYTAEYLAAKAYAPAYHRAMTESIKKAAAIVVSNGIAKAHVGTLNDNVHIITGGVDLDDFPYVPESETPSTAKRMIFFGGRADAHAKGFGVLLAAAEQLAKTRDDFEIRATHGRLVTKIPWLADAGWVPHDRMKEWYQRSSVCVIPSIWEEPFGLVAVEAMATGRPVCVSRVGGLQHIPVHGESGYVYDRQDACALAGHLSDLLDDPRKRATMGAAGRRRVEDVFAWDTVIEKSYPPLLESIRT